jgi:hypothetical protein
MSTDSRIEADLKALADESARGLPTIEQTARALAGARAPRTGGRIMQIIQKPVWATAVGIAVVVAVLVCPVPYTRTVGYELTVKGAGGRVGKVLLRTRDGAVAEKRAAMLRKPGTVVDVAPRTEHVWGSVYAMAKDKLVSIHVDLDGKSDAEVVDEIKKQFDQAGWNATDVQVQRGDGESTVEIGADDGQGRHMKIVRKAQGGDEKAMDLELGGIDDEHEPGMTDDQLREKILKQLKARGLDGDVKVSNGRVEIRATGKKEVEE